MDTSREEVRYALDIVRFLAMDAVAKRELLAREGAAEWLAQSKPLRGVLEEFSQNAQFLFDPDMPSLAEKPLEELIHLVDLVLWADDHHPNKFEYTATLDALEVPVWRLVERLANEVFVRAGMEVAPFVGDWRMIFAR